MDKVGLIIALVLTLMVYSYLIGDNPLFKLAEHILVGVSVGWAVIQVLFNLILPTLAAVRDGFGANGGNFREAIALLIPLVLGVILLTRPLRATRPLSNLAMAVVIGTVAALSLAGALSGTLLPQVGASLVPLNANGDPFGLLGKIVLLVGTLASLWYFQFTVLRSRNGTVEGGTTGLANLSDRFRLLGRWSIMLAFGAVFAAVFLTYFAALLDRLLFVINFRL